MLSTILSFSRARVLYVVIGAAALSLGWYFFSGGGKSAGTTITIVPSDVSEQVRVSGTVTAAQNVDLGFAANGRIASVRAMVGEHLGEGAVIAEIENGDLAAAVAQKEATLAERQADLAALLAGTRPEQITVASTSVANAQTALLNALQNAYTTTDDAVHNKADVLFTNPRTSPLLSFTVTSAAVKISTEQDRASLEPVLIGWAALIARLSSAASAGSATLAQKYLAQVTALLADANAALNNGVSDQTTTTAMLASYATALATARANVNAATTAIVAASSALAAAEKNLALEQAGATPDALAASRAAVAAAAADVASAHAALAKTLVVAPFDGIITRMDAKVGEVVAPTASEISMQSDGVFEIETYVPEVAISGIAIGNPATTTLDAYGSSVAFRSKVIATDPAETVKDGVPTYKVTLAFFAADARIRSGMTANVVIETGMLHDAIVVPVGAITTKSGETSVSVVIQGKSMPRSVSTGVSPSFGQVEILSGLAKGDVILLTPAP